MVERVEIDGKDWWYYDGLLYENRSDIGRKAATGLGLGVGVVGLAVAIPMFFLSRWPVPTLLVALMTRFDAGCALLWWYADKVNHVHDPASVCIALAGMGLAIGIQHGVNALVSLVPATGRAS